MKLSIIQENNQFSLYQDDTRIGQHTSRYDATKHLEKLQLQQQLQPTHPTLQERLQNYPHHQLLTWQQAFQSCHLPIPPALSYVIELKVPTPEIQTSNQYLEILMEDYQDDQKNEQG